MRAKSPLRISQLNSLIQSFLKGLGSTSFLPTRAVLYGSYAKGHPRYDGSSDVDLAVWLSPEPEKHWTEYPELLALVSAHPPVSPRFYATGDGPEDDAFIEEILKTGKEIPLEAMLAADSSQ